MLQISAYPESGQISVGVSAEEEIVTTFINHLEQGLVPSEHHIKLRAYFFMDPYKSF